MTDAERAESAALAQARSRTKHDRLVSALAVLATGALILGTDVTLCPLAGLFGIPCPSCGLTRASLAVVVGELSRAQGIHPGVLPVLAYLALAAGVTMKWRSRPPVMRWLGILGLAMLGGLIVLWGIRFGGAFGGPVKVHPWRW